MNIIAYFSVPETDGVDTVAGASRVVVDGEVFGNNQYIAQLIQQETGGDLFLSMLGTMVSAIILSREVFAFLPISGGIALARSMHIFCSFWGFVLMAPHLGLHWNIILGMIRKASGPIQSKPLKIGLCLTAAAVAVYGLYSFIKNQFLSYMFLTTTFVFLILSIRSHCFLQSISPLWICLCS